MYRAPTGESWRMKDERKAVVLLSGGMDSCVCVALALARHGGGNVGWCMPAMDRGPRGGSGGRLRRLRILWVSERLMVRLEHFRAIGGSALTDSRIAVPENELGAAVSAIPVTYVPFAMRIFFPWRSVGRRRLGWRDYIGAVAEDSSGYPDCRPEYYRVFQELIRVGTKPETELR